jgi:hypothetical protein
MIQINSNDMVIRANLIVIDHKVILNVFKIKIIVMVSSKVVVVEVDVVEGVVVVETVISLEFKNKLYNLKFFKINLSK